jgi:hypothetical protein
MNQTTDVFRDALAHLQQTTRNIFIETIASLTNDKSLLQQLSNNETTTLIQSLPTTATTIIASLINAISSNCNDLHSAGVSRLLLASLRALCVPVLPCGGDPLTSARL